MTVFAPLVNAAWAASTFCELALLAVLVYRRATRFYPLFTVYVGAVFLQSLAIAAVYRREALLAWSVWEIAWGSQVIVKLMKSLALAELTRRILAKYAGIWALVRRLLGVVGFAVLGYALLFSRGRWDWLVLNTIRGLELAMAAFIVAVLLFARYYRLPIAPLPRAIIVGMCLYSLFYVINYTLLERVVQSYSNLWNFVDVLTFFATLLIWIQAACRFEFPEQARQAARVSPETYREISSQVNLRLYLLNRQLTRIANSEDRRS